jgi:LysR family transcriptional regulator, hydrogen peroxide-inducible genes activator
LYYEPFVAYIPSGHRLSKIEKLEVEDLDVDDMLLLEDGHCFKDGILNLCKASRNYEGDNFQLESGSFETLIKLSNEGLGMTLLPYLHTLDVKESEKAKRLKMFKDPVPAREVSLIYNKSELKIQIIEALRTTIAGVIKGAIAFQNVKIISPVGKK